MLLLQNIRVSLRNLMKYKAQNLISILCLAVGIVCFTVTLHFVVETWYLAADETNASRSATFTLKPLSEGDDATPMMSGTALAQLQRQMPPSIEYLVFKERNYNIASTLIDADDRESQLDAEIMAISPDYLQHYQYRSAITGKRIPRLKPGTILMGEALWRKTLVRDDSPMGWRIRLSGYKTVTAPVADMVHSDLRDVMDAILVVKEMPVTDGEDWVYGMDAVLHEGQTLQDLRQQLESLYPDRQVIVDSRANHAGNRLQILSIFVLILFLGSSVLIIGSVGFLKMQLQLFHLRSRELALRRCVGARPWQLFSLLAIEVCVVFLLTAGVSLALTVLIADYATPIMDETSNGSFYLDMPVLLRRQLVIIIVTLLSTLTIAALSVRRIIHAPLGMTAGRSHRTSRAGRNVMLVSQYVVCILFLFAVLLVSYFVRMTARAQRMPEDVSLLKRCVQAEGRLLTVNRWCSTADLPSAEYVGHGLETIIRTTEMPDTTVCPYYYTLRNSDGSIYCYGYSIWWINADYLLATGQHPTIPVTGQDSLHMVPLYADVADAERMARLLGAPDGPRQRRVLADGKQRVCLGFLPIYEPGRPTYSYYVLDPEMSIEGVRGMPNLVGINMRPLVILPKPHRQQQLRDEMDELYHRLNPSRINPLSIQRTYDVWFAQVRTYNFALQLIGLLALVSLLCIILSVYSSVALDTRSREKEVAIRKVHGATTGVIMRLFGGYYLRLLAVSALLSAPIGIGVGTIVLDIMNAPGSTRTSFVSMLGSLLIVAAVTAVTVSHKIYRVSRTNPANVIKKD